MKFPKQDPGDPTPTESMLAPEDDDVAGAANAMLPEPSSPEPGSKDEAEAASDEAYLQAARQAVQAAHAEAKTARLAAIASLKCANCGAKETVSPSLRPPNYKTLPSGDMLPRTVRVLPPRKFLCLACQAQHWQKGGHEEIRKPDKRESSKAPPPPPVRCEICHLPFAVSSLVAGEEVVPLPCLHGVHLECMERICALSIEENAVCPKCHTQKDETTEVDKNFTRGCAVYCSVQFQVARSDKGWSVLSGDQRRRIAEVKKRWCTAADQEGDPRAQFNLGALFEDGTGVKVDELQASKWFEKAAKQQFTKAQVRLGRMLRDGRGLAQNDKQAAKWYLQAASLGDPGAQFTAGYLFRNGKGVVRNYEKAASFFRLAAEQGNADAQYTLGCLHVHGKGVVRSDDEAERWFLRAGASHHHPAAAAPAGHQAPSGFAGGGDSGVSEAAALGLKAIAARRANRH